MYLKSRLTPEKLIFSEIVVGAQKHVNHNVVKIWLASLTPFYEDEHG